MKIITNTKRCGELCYIQVKDVLFLARYTKNEPLLEKYIKLINNGLNDDVFIRVDNEGLKQAIKMCDSIVDFCEFADNSVSIAYLSNLLVNINTIGLAKEDKESIKYKSDAIRDIMSFKKGELDYTIPLVPSGEVEYENEEGVLFESTVVNDCFIVHMKDGSDIMEHDYYQFYLDCLDRIYSTIYSQYNRDNLEYKGFNRNNMIIVKIEKTPLKKESKVKQVLSKVLKKGN